MVRPQEVEMTHYSVGQAIDSLGFGRFQVSWRLCSATHVIKALVAVENLCRIHRAG